jgi:Protein of unknown function (DUF4058)
MPSPFPGMDPYLEHPAFFPGLHDRFITYLSESVQEKLPEPYYAEMSDRVWVEISSRNIGPDVKVLRTQTDRPSPGGFAAPAAREQEDESGGVAVAVSRKVIVHVPHDEFREPFLQIFAKLEGERLITSIEILSLANKAPGAQGRDLYLRKQKEILGSQVHLVEIDLLRGGEHATAVPHELLLEKASPLDYHVCVHEYDKLEDFVVYPICLHERLPVIDIPLLPGDGAIAVNLQQVFQRCYETGPYHRRLDYRTLKPEPPLSAERATWAAGLLAKG